MRRPHRNEAHPTQRFIAAASLALACACAPPVGPDSEDPTDRPDSGAGASSTDAGPAEVPGIRSSAIKPNVMLLIDRSGSMATPTDCGAASCPSRWDELLSLGSYLAEAKQLARLGLAVFPGYGQSCGVDANILVPLGDAENIDELILTAAAQSAPGGGTPLAAALDRVVEQGRLDDPQRDNILLIMTDGDPNCACPTNGDRACERASAVAAVERAVRRPVPIDIDVIGFSSSALSAQQTLTAMAAAAGDARYYQANTIEELIGTLYEVSVSRVPCKFNLDEWPEPGRLIVWMDGQQVAACTAQPCQRGYVYDPTTGVVVFEGETCAALRDGQHHQVWFDSRK